MNPSTGIANVESRGVLADRALGSGPEKRQRLAVSLRYVYHDDGPVSFGGQAFDLSHLALVRLGRETELRTEAGVAVFPMAAVGSTTRGSPRSSSAAASTTVQSVASRPRPACGGEKSTSSGRRGASSGSRRLDGVSRGSRIHSFAVEGRVPLFRDRYSVGAAWGWSERTTTYDVFPTVERSGSAVRLFAAVTFR